MDVYFNCCIIGNPSKAGLQASTLVIESGYRAVESVFGAFAVLVRTPDISLIIG